ncbi:hypothetical protein AAIB33_14690 [Microbacterium sp. AZCO]|uniref:hypothetical protein n=1 Tax=Microbacterium sp. AZCO TaxID=3142976 RepID=UPI0031F46F2A
MLLVDPAAVTLALVGLERWGSTWSEALDAAGESRTVVADEDTDDESQAFPWIAQKPGAPGPWVSAASPEEARAAGIAEDIGFDEVSTVFGRIAGRSA